MQLCTLCTQKWEARVAFAVGVLSGDDRVTWESSAAFAVGVWSGDDRVKWESTAAFAVGCGVLMTG